MGYGVQKKESLTGAVTAVDSKAFQGKGSVTNPLQALQGQVAGVMITRGEYPIASIHDRDIEDIWNDERYQAARIMLYNYSRDFKPCSGCTNVSVRVGFLPDSSGQESLPKITKEVKRLAQSVAKENKPLSTIVKRPWEKETEE